MHRKGAFSSGNHLVCDADLPGREVGRYQTAVLLGDAVAVAEIPPTLRKEQLKRVAHFLEGRGAYMCLRRVLLLLQARMLSLNSSSLKHSCSG